MRRYNGNFKGQTINGSAKDDTIFGRGGDDIVFGKGGNDHIDGGDGNDQLCGGAGDDLLTGGPGSDTFVFGLTPGNDTITDFVSGIDRIDLSQFDITLANVSAGGVDSATKVSVDLDLDGVTDFQITLLGSVASPNDFIF